MSETQKTAVIFGLANKRSIAWAIALKLQEAGYRLAIVYQNDRLEQEARDLIADGGGWIAVGHELDGVPVALAERGFFEVLRDRVVNRVEIARMDILPPP